MRQFARCRPQQHRHHHQCLCYLVLQPGVSLLRWVGWTWYRCKRMKTLLETYSWHLKHGDWKMSFLLGRHPARCPSSQNHGSVENGCVSNIRFLSFRVIFHWTVIMGERVLYCSSWNIIWPPVTPLDTGDGKNLHYLGPNPNWCRISSINSITLLDIITHACCHWFQQGVFKYEAIGKGRLSGKQFFQEIQTRLVELVQDFHVLWFLCIFALRWPRFFFGRRLPVEKGIFQPFNPNFFHLW